MKNLGKLPNVYVKLSMLSFIKFGWETDAEGKKFITNLVREVIGIFGTKRCMFASNFPVDIMSSPHPGVLYDAFQEMVADLSAEEKRDLFWETADKAYRLSDSAKI